jgi:hypothetical protein
MTSFALDAAAAIASRLRRAVFLPADIELMGQYPTKTLEGN